MALNEQVFRAPSIPKMNRRNISSPVMTGADIASSPRLKRSTFSFLGGERRGGVGSSLRAESTSLDVQLQETNRVLVEIQKQLSLDFANRITEKRQALRVSKVKLYRDRAGAKEKAVESARNFGAGFIRVFDKVTAPAKSIFQKILDFFSIIVTGLLVNNAFKWLENPANREKLSKFFKFVTKHWKELLALYAAGKLLRIVSALRRLADLFKRRPPRWPGGGNKPGGGSGGGGPSGGGGCGPVIDCIKNIGGQSAEKLAKILSNTKVFAPLFTLLPRPKPVQAPKPPKDVYGDLPPGVREDLERGGKTQTPGIDLVTFVIAPLVAGLISSGALAGFSLSSVIAGLSRFGVRAPKPPSPPPVPAEAAAKINPRTIRILETFNKSVERGGMSSKSNIGKSPEQVLSEQMQRHVGNAPASGIRTFTRGHSLGGTVGGTGSGNVDSVPAMLAPGEEVIRASAAMLFRPLLKDINNNAGRMWNTFSDAIGGLVSSNDVMETALRTLAGQLTLFKKQLDQFVSDEKLKKEKGGGIGKVSTMSSRNNMVSPELVLHSDIKNIPARKAKTSIIPIDLGTEIIPSKNIPKYSADGGVATKEPRISSSNPLNPYMEIVPEMLGIFV